MSKLLPRHHWPPLPCHCHQRWAIARAQLFARWNVRLRQPLGGEVAAPAAIILRHIARDIAELEGKAEIDTDTARRLFTLICVLHIKG